MRAARHRHRTRAARHPARHFRRPWRGQDRGLRPLRAAPPAWNSPAPPGRGTRIHLRRRPRRARHGGRRSATSCMDFRRPGGHAMTTLHRRALLAATLALPARVRRCSAGARPARPVTVVNPWPPAARRTAWRGSVHAALRPGLGQNFVVENRAGASGTIGQDQRRARRGRWLHAALRHQQHLCHRAAPDQPAACPMTTARLHRASRWSRARRRSVCVHPSVRVKTIRSSSPMAAARPGRDELLLGRHRRAPATSPPRC